MNEIFMLGHINSVRNITVERRLIYALQGAYMGRPKIVYGSKGLYAVGGKILYGGERFYYGRVIFDCDRIPTYHTGSSEDSAECCSGYMQP